MNSQTSENKFINSFKTQFHLLVKLAVVLGIYIVSCCSTHTTQSKSLFDISKRLLKKRRIRGRVGQAGLLDGGVMVWGRGEGRGKDWQKDSTIVELFKKRES